MTENNQNDDVQEYLSFEAQIVKGAAEISDEDEKSNNLQEMMEEQFLSPSD